MLRITDGQTNGAQLRYFEDSSKSTQIPRRKPIMTLSRQEFANISPLSERLINQILVYSHNQVSLIREGDQEIAVSLHDIPPLNDTQLKEYLIQSHFLVTELTDGSYKLTALPRILGGGCVFSKVTPKNSSPSNNITTPSAHTSRGVFTTTSASPLENSSASAQQLYNCKDNPFPTTEALAVQMKNNPRHSSYASWQALALKVIDLFAQTPSKSKPIIEEVTALAYAKNTTITKFLLETVVDEIKNNTLLNIDLLKALKTILIESLINDLDADDLMEVLKTTIQRINKIHRQPSTNEKIRAALSTISDILDVMIDAKVNDVERIDIHDPLYKSLDQLSHHDDIFIAAQAAYAKQALIRLPNDETKCMSRLRHAYKFAQALSSIYGFISNKDLSLLVDAYNNMLEAATFQETQKRWYIEVRILKLLSEKKEYKLFQDMIEKHIKTTTNPHIIGNILFILHDITHHNLKPDPSERKWALDRMVYLYDQCVKFGGNENDKQNIVTQLKDCATLPDEASSSHAKEILKLLKIELDPITKSAQDVENSSKILIRTALGSNLLTLEQKLQDMKERALANEDVKNDLSLYTDVNASRRLLDPKEQPFKLDDEIDKFLKEEQKKVFLLLGQSGGGKSTYLRWLENRLWKEWNDKKPIPLFISLPTLKLPFKEAIKEALNERGFTEAEQNELKATYSFLFLMDGYDELKQKRNLYEENKLNDWKAKVIITYRTQYLEGEQTSYTNYFSPDSNSTSNLSLDAASTSPFNEDQIKAYCCKYIKLKNIPITWDEYKAKIDSVLAEIIENPFLLRIIVEVLPDIIDFKNPKSQKKLIFRRIEIFDAFAKKWFNHEEQRLLGTGVEINISNLKDYFASFAKNLALAMVNEEKVSVDYDESNDMFDFDHLPSKWEKFFSTDSKIALIRSGIPLRKIGPHSYAFIHKALLEYFCAKAIISDNKYVFERLNKISLAKEPEIINLLAQCVTLDPSLENELFECINRSKNNPLAAVAAANAITILNKAEVNLSRRDFKGIQIPGADLSHALITSTDLSEADLSNVQFNEAVLDYSTIEGSKAAGLELGQKIIKRLGFNCSALSSDGKNVLKVNFIEGVINLLDGNGEQRRSFHGNREIINSVALSQDGKWALIGRKHTADLWNCDDTSKEEPRSSPEHAESITSVALSPNGKWALYGSYEKTVRLWDCESNHEKQFDNEHSDRINTVAISPDGKRALSGSRDKTVRLWDCQSGHMIQCFEGHTKEVNCVAISTNGEMALSGSEDNTVCLWDCKSGHKLQRFEGHTESVKTVAFSPDGKWALSGGSDNIVRLWDCQTGKQLYSFVGHNDVVTCVNFSPDGKLVRSIDRYGTTRTWNLNRMGNHTTKTMPYLREISPDGKWGLVKINGETVDLWDCHTGKVRCSFLMDIDKISSFAVSPDGNWALFGIESQTLNLYKCDTGEKLLSFPKYDGPVGILAFSSNGQRALSGNNDKTLLWDCKTGSLLDSFSKHSSPITSVAFSPNGNLALSGSLSGTICVWDCNNHTMLHSSSKHTTKITHLAVSPNDEWALSGSEDGTVCLWDCKTDNTLDKTLQMKGGLLNCLAFSSDGKLALFGGHDYICIWDCKTGTQLHRLSSGAKYPYISTDEKSILFKGKNNMELYELIVENDTYKLALKWSFGNMPLSAEQLNMKGVQGLSDYNRKLFIQHGAKG